MKNGNDRNGKMPGQENSEQVFFVQRGPAHPNEKGSSIVLVERTQRNSYFASISITEIAEVMIIISVSKLKSSSHNV